MFSLIRKELFIGSLKDPLYVNSLYILLSTLINAISGFFFWVIAARYYSQTDIGISTGIISSMGLLLLISRFGLDQSLVRFFPERDGRTVFSTILITTSVLIFLCGIIFILGINLWSPDLQMLRKYSLLYLLFLVANSVMTIIGTTSLSLRRGSLYFIRTIIFASRIFLLIPLMIYGSLGIVGSIGIANILTIFILMDPQFRSISKLSYFDYAFLKDAFNFSFGNFIATAFIELPGSLLPLIVLNELGARDAASYYLVYTIANFIFTIPASFSISLFIEGSYGEALKKETIKSLSAIFSLLIPIIFSVYLLGRDLLGFIGKDYVNAFPLLIVMVLSSIFYSVYQVFFSIKRVQKDIFKLIYLSGFNFSSLLVLTYLCTSKYGLIGVGYAWLISYVFSNILIFWIIKKEFGFKCLLVKEK